MAAVPIDPVDTVPSTPVMSTVGAVPIFAAFATSNYGSAAGVVANFGQDDTFAGAKTTGSAEASDGNGIGDFYYTPPSDFLALCASNLQNPTIGPEQTEQSDDNFNTLLYTGDGNITEKI